VIGNNTCITVIGLICCSARCATGVTSMSERAFQRSPAGAGAEVWARNGDRPNFGFQTICKDPAVSLEGGGAASPLERLTAPHTGSVLNRARVSGCGLRKTGLFQHRPELLAIHFRSTLFK